MDDSKAQDLAIDLTGIDWEAVKVAINAALAKRFSIEIPAEKLLNYWWPGAAPTPELFETLKTDPRSAAARPENLPFLKKLPGLLSHPESLWTPESMFGPVLAARIDAACAVVIVADRQKRKRASDSTPTPKQIASQSFTYWVIDRVLEIVNQPEQNLHITRMDIIDDNRQLPFAFVRNISMYLTRELVKESPLKMEYLARAFGRDHSALSLACRKVEAMQLGRNDDTTERNYVNYIVDQVKNRFNETVAARQEMSADRWFLTALSESVSYDNQPPQPDELQQAIAHYIRRALAPPKPVQVAPDASPRPNPAPLAPYSSGAVPMANAIRYKIDPEAPLENFPKARENPEWAEGAKNAGISTFGALYKTKAIQNADIRDKHLWAYLHNDLAKMQMSKAVYQPLSRRITTALSRIAGVALRDTSRTAAASPSTPERT